MRPGACDTTGAAGTSGTHRTMESSSPVGPAPPGPCDDPTSPPRSSADMVLEGLLCRGGARGAGQAYWPYCGGMHDRPHGAVPCGVYQFARCGWSCWPDQGIGRSLLPHYTPPRAAHLHSPFTSPAALLLLRSSGCRWLASVSMTS